MRHSYDCLIVGDDPAACLIALELQKSGLRAALVTAASTSAGTGYWLIPTSEQAVAWPRLANQLPDLERFVQRKLVLEQVDMPTHRHASPQAVWLVDAEDYSWQCRSMCRRQGVEVLEEVDRACMATITLEPRSMGEFSQPMIWGNYRQVSREVGPQGGTALTFSSQTGAQWWLVPLDDEITSVGAQLPTATNGRTELRNAWEDELVACPSLVERLFDAQLDGALQCWPASPPERRVQDSAANYQPCSTTSPLDCPWESLWAAEELAQSLVPRLRRAPVF